MTAGRKQRCLTIGGIRGGIRSTDGRPGGRGRWTAAELEGQGEGKKQRGRSGWSRWRFARGPIWDESL